MGWYSNTDPNVIATNYKEEYGMAHRRAYARSQARRGKGLTLATMVLSGWLLAGLSIAISIGFGGTANFPLRRLLGEMQT